MIRLILAALLCALDLPAAAQPLRVMSFNVRVPIDREAQRTWEARLPVAAAAIARERPAVVGTQELHKRQGDDLIARVPGYAWFGIDRRGGHGDEHMGVLYDRRQLRVVELGNFWLSDTPDVPGGITWGHPYPRMVTWAIFERIADRRRFRLFNTHLPYRAEDEAARVKGAAMLVDRLATLPGTNLPTVLTGDFNTTPDSEPHRLLAAAMTDAWTAAARRSGPAETFHNWSGTADRRIDWIFARGFDVRATRTLADRRGPVWASDHFPVVADLAFTR